MKQEFDAQTAGHMSGSAATETPWYQKLARLMALIFCFELGVFLAMFPWISEWHQNYLSSLPLWTEALWNSSYFRGAVSGIGLLNIYISISEVARLRRSSGTSK